MKLYTRTGDDGSTGLFGGSRTHKDSLRVATYGTVDELNSVLGMAVCAAADDAVQPIRDMLIQMQSRLFDLGADLATPMQGENAKQTVRIVDRHVEELEQWIDRVSGELPAMTHFILPGGSELAARLHMARCVARRAERLVVTLNREQLLGDSVVPYINRISDLLFAMARWANLLQGIDDVPWIAEREKR